MPQNPEQVDFFADADVFFTTNLSAPNPSIGADFSAAWFQVGVLNGEDGFTTAREEESTKHYGWGTYIGERRRNFSETRSFVALETNPYTRMLRYPGSAPGEIRQPDRSIQYKVGFEKREGSKVHRLISANRADITLDGDVQENETDPTGLTFIVSPIPDNTGKLWIEQGGPDDIVAVTDLTLTAPGSIAQNKIGRVTATAKFDGGSPIDVTDAVAWTTSDPLKALVYPGGFVTAVDDNGTVTITGVLHGNTESKSITLTA